MLSNVLRASLVASFVLAAACGGATPAPTTTPPAGSDTSALPPAPSASAAAPAGSAAPAADAALPTTWSDSMSKPQMIAFMKKNVAPRLAKAFQAHDASKYANFDCKTCHGPDYKNPHEFLPHLTVAGGTITQIKDKPEISKWMHEVVVPEMASAMGLPAYDPATQKGFGCGGCHKLDMK